MTYLRQYQTMQTPQSEQIPGSNQTPNNAGGWGWEVDDWTKLSRFLAWGSEGGTYYVGEARLTRQSAEATLRCIKEDGLRAVARIVEISTGGRAPKNDPALFALALAAAHGDTATKRAAFAALPRVARIGTHLFHFLAYADGFRGWGRGLRKAVAGWYNSDAEALAYDAVKYQSRDGWSHRDALRLAHPKAGPGHDTLNAVYHWIVKGWPDVGEEPHPDAALRIVWAFERAKRATTAEEVAALIREYRLPREAVPSQWLTDRMVWEALAESMPMTALIRNLATLTRVGVIGPSSAKATERLAAQITDADRLRRARVHPIALLAALKTYAQGRGERSANTWEPNAKIVDALNDAFYLAFGSVEPTGKRIVLGLDVSGSMAGTKVVGIAGLEARTACGALALVTAAVELHCTIMAFDTAAHPLSISPKQRLDDVVKVLAKTGGGGTDCAIPITWAMERGIEADAFVILTDSETWQGRQHPAQAIQAYRRKTGIRAKLVVVAMASSLTTIADPSDNGIINVVGFDTALPDLLGAFIRD